MDAPSEACQVSGASVWEEELTCIKFQLVVRPNVGHLLFLVTLLGRRCWKLRPREAEAEQGLPRLVSGRAGT